MREYKIVEFKDGHGNPKFKVKAKVGWGIFSWWEEWSQTKDTMQEAQDKVKEYISREKDKQRVKVKEYIYTAVPNHIPDEQIGKFMEINQKKV
jgi:hypothetical protein